MAFAITPPAYGALTNYDGLVAYIRDRLDDSTYSERRIQEALRMAEAHLRRELPMGDAPVSISVVITDDSAASEPAQVLNVGDPATASIYPYLTPLTSAAPSNWLLQRHPDVYAVAVLYYCHQRSGDQENMDVTLTLLNNLLPSARRSEITSQWGRGPLIPTGITQTRGARA